jgi:hypothetical protein
VFHDEQLQAREFIWSTQDVLPTIGCLEGSDGLIENRIVAQAYLARYVALCVLSSKTTFMTACVRLPLLELLQYDDTTRVI